MRSASALAIILMVVFAGCAGASTSDPSAGDTPTENLTPALTPTEAPTTTPTETETETTTATETPVDADFAPSRNPFGREPVIVTIRGETESNRTDELVRALEYWNSSGVEYAKWEPKFKLVADPVNTPDIVVRFVPPMDCYRHDEDKAIGCAPLLEDPLSADSPELLRVEEGLTEESTYRTLRHEFGHVLGLEHGEGPDDVMAPYDTVFRESVGVFVDAPNHRQDQAQSQIQFALDYYNNGASGTVDDSIEMEYVSSGEAADIVVSVSDDSDSENGYSDMNRSTTRTEIVVRGIDWDRVSWHVGYWLGFYFGAETVDDLPPPFDEPETEDRDGWWHGT